MNANAKDIKFKCPLCNAVNKLEEVAQDALVYTPIVFLTDNGIDYGRPVIQEANVLGFECVSCGYFVQDEDGNIITEEEDLIEYLLECQ